MNKTIEGLLGTLMVILLIVGSNYMNPMLVAKLVFAIMFLYFSYRSIVMAYTKLTKATK